MQAAKSVLIDCGHYDCSFMDFTAAMDSLIHMGYVARQKVHDIADPSSQDWLRYVYFLDQHKSKAVHRYYGDWFKIIIKGAVYEATLPQDRIFSMLSVATRLDRDKSGESLQTNGISWVATTGFPEIDYGKSVSLVFQDFIKHTINLEASLNCLAIFQDRRARDTDLPSWVIDLRVNVPGYLDSFDVSKHFRLTRIKKQDYNAQGVLLVQGYADGRIESQAQEPPFQADSIWDKETDLHIWSLKNCYIFEDIAREARGDISDLHMHLITVLQQECNYTWKQICLDSPVSGMSTEKCKRRETSQWHAHALVPDLAKYGDCLVGLKGSRHVFMVRPATGNRHTFLGPALCCISAMKPAWTLERHKEWRNRVWDSSDEEETNQEICHSEFLSASDFRRPGVAEDDFLLI